MGKRRTLGRDAKWALGIGDSEVAVAGPEKRLDLLDAVGERDRRMTVGTGATRTQRIERTVVRHRRTVEIRAKKREVYNTAHSAKIRQATLWRAAGIEQRLTVLDWPKPARAVVGTWFAGVAYYVFAKAYAYIDRSGGHATFIVGGMFGLLTFLVGVLVAHGWKTVGLARAERRLVDDSAGNLPDADQMIVARPQTVQTVLASLVFAALAMLVAIVRYQGLAVQDRHLSISAIQGLVPLVALLAELWLYNPVHDRAKEPGLVERYHQTRTVVLLARIETVKITTEFAADDVRLATAVEKEMLEIEQDDMFLVAAAELSNPRNASASK